MNSSSFKTNLKHVAIIMDGNGRWAQDRAHTRIWGHIRGSRIVSSIVEEADECGVEALTLYAFSTENWSRPFKEVKVLFKLLKKFLIIERKRILQNKIRFKIIGDISQLPEETKALIKKLEDDTKDAKGLKLTFAFGYGGRDEVIKSVNKFIEKNPGKKISEAELNQSLYAPECGDVDLLIRTGGDFRVSNFLLWQIAYAELYFTPSKWPDFTRKEFREILFAASSRERRFGAVEAGSDLTANMEKASKQKNSLKFS